MKVIKTIQPGQAGSMRFTRRFGERLVAVRYRRDRERKALFTTVEVIVDQRDYLPQVNQDTAYAHHNNRWVAVNIRAQGVGYALRPGPGIKGDGGI